MRLPLQTRWWCRRRMVLTFLLIVLCVSLPWGSSVLAEVPRSALFPLPEALRPNVAFWKRIFTVFDTSGGMLHDASDVSIVYEIWYNDLPEDRQLRQSIIDDAFVRYRMALTNLADGKRLDLTSDEERLWRMFQGKRQADTFRAAANNLRFQGGVRSRFAQGVERSWSYLPEIESIFASMGLPQELTLLPHVESSFQNRARSKAGAAGLWQFMPATGRRFLRVNRTVDERLDVRKATIAAARLLRENYELLGTWPLAVTAYNHGAYGMKRAVNAVGSTDFGLIVQQYRGPLFGFASQNFYAEFLAAVEVAQNYRQYFDERLFQESPERPLTVDASGFGAEPVRPILMARYAALTPLGRVEARHLPAGQPYVPPPALVTPAHTAVGSASPTPGTPVETLTPIVESGTFSTPRSPQEPPAVVLTASVPPAEPTSSPTSTFVAPVRARTTPVEAASLMASVPADEPPVQPRPARRAVVPSQIVTPAAAAPEASRSVGHASRPSAPALPSPTPVAAPQALHKVSSRVYRVRPGDTLSALAQEHHITTSTLARLNTLRPNAELKVGQRLLVPRPLPTSRPPVLVAEKALPAPPSASVLAAITGGKPALTLAEATQPALPVPPLHAGVGTQGLGVPAPVERFQVKGETIRVAAHEQLERYASWLHVPVQRLQKLNRFPAGQLLAIGTPVRLDFSQVSVATFTHKRLQYHRRLEETFFRRYRVSGVHTRTLKPGETLLSVSRRAPGVPLWLLQRYNIHLEATKPSPGWELRVPQVIARAS